MNKIKILISFDLENRYVRKIESVSPKIEVQKSENYSEILKLIENADILVPRIFSPEIFLAAKKLKWIQTCGAGVDHFLFPEVVESQVIVTNSSGVSQIPISEHVIGIMICFSRKIHYYASQKQRKWKKNPDELMKQMEELSGKTAGIVGLGRIGNYIAKKIKNLGMRVIATKINPLQETPAHIDKLFSHQELDKLLAESDFVILTAPLTKETKSMIGESQLKKMKKSSYLINVSRGKIVQEEKLIQALKNGWIAGAGLDTFETEPLSKNSELWDMENVIITPHIAGLTPHYWDRVTDIICDNLKRFIYEKPLKNIVNKTVGY